MNNYGFKEYTRIRDIVVKRNKRAVAAGLAPLIHFPTIKEIKAGVVGKKEALSAVSEYYKSGSQVKAIRQSGNVPSFPEFSRLDESSYNRDKKAERRAKDRIRRRYKKALEGVSSELAGRYTHYLKALEGLQRKWQLAGMDLGISVDSLSPKEAQAFVEYMDFRYSQGDYTNEYVIDVFIQQFRDLLHKGYRAERIVDDFNQFLEDRNQLEMEYLTMEGLTKDEANALWKKFVRK